MTITLDGTAYKVWPVKPDWSVSPRLTLTAPSVLVESETGIASAQKRGSIRIQYEAQYWIEPDTIPTLEAITLDPSHPWIALPLWNMPAAVAGSYWGIGDPISSIVQSATRPEGTAIPLAFGRIDNPTITAMTDNLGAWKLNFIEDCPASARVVVAATHAPEWPAALQPEWSTPVRLLYHTPLNLTTYADQRSSQREGEYAPPKLGQSAGFKLEAEEIDALIAFWAAMHGEVGTFAAPRWFDPSQQGTTLPMRFSTAKLALTFTTDLHASTTVSLIEAEPADTTTGATAHLYEFTYQVKPPQVYRFTDWEADLIIEETTWSTRPIQIESIDDGLLTEDHGLSLTAHTGDWNPLMKFIPFRLEGRMLLQVFQIDVDTGSGSLIWAGDVEQVNQADGERISVQCGAQYGLLDRQAPRLMLSPKCNHRFGDARCGVNRDAWSEQATITSATGASLSLAGLTSASGFYTGGLLECGSGPTYERRTITAHTGTQISIGKRLLYSHAGATVTVAPGCDRSWQGCARFVNQARFSGFPSMPEENPTMEAVQDDGSTGKK